MISLIVASICAFMIGRLSFKYGNVKSRAYWDYCRAEFIVRIFAIDFIHCANRALRLARNGVNWPMEELKRIIESICGHRMCYAEAIEYIHRLENQMNKGTSTYQYRPKGSAV